MLRIRLQRVGRKHEPTFRLVLTDSRNSTKSGRFLEVLGSYDPRGNRPGAFNKERIQYVISKGAKPTDTVHNLLVKYGIVSGQKRDVSSKKKGGEKEKEASAETGATAEASKEKKPAEEKKEVVTEDSTKETPVPAPEPPVPAAEKNA